MPDYDTMPAGREMDKAIAAFMGTPFLKPGHGPCCTCQICGHYHDDCQCYYSEDIEMAWRAWEKIKDRHYYMTWSDEGEKWVVFEGSDWFFVTEAETPELAMCRAALKEDNDRPAS